MQVVRKGNDFAAGIKQDTSNPAFARRIGQSLEPAKVAAVQSGASLDFDIRSPTLKRSSKE
jgi:hypothetical protein